MEHAIVGVRHKVGDSALITMRSSTPSESDGMISGAPRGRSFDLQPYGDRTL